MERTLYRLVALEASFLHYGWARWLLRVLIILALAFALVAAPSGFNAHFVLGLAIVVLPVEVSLDIYRLFLRSAIGKEEARAARLAKAGKRTVSYEAARLLMHQYETVDTLWRAVARTYAARFVLAHLGAAPSQLPVASDSRRVQKIVNAAAVMAANEQRPLAVKHLFEALQESTAVESAWESLDIHANDRQPVWRWYEVVKSKHDQIGRIWPMERIAASGGIGRDWSSGFHPNLDRYASDLTQAVLNQRLDIESVGHADEQQMVIGYLAKNFAHNALLVGNDGIGKDRIILSLASRISEGEVPVRLARKRLFRLDVGRVVNGVDQPTFEARLTAIFNEAVEAGNIILAVEDIDLLLGGVSNKAGTVDASAIMLPYLESSQIQFIATISSENYHRYIESNPALKPVLISVPIHEIKAADTLEIILETALGLETQLGVTFTYQALERLVAIADERVHDRPFPDKALRLFSDVAAHLKKPRGAVITIDDIESVAGTILRVPLGRVTSDEKTKLMSLESILSQRIVGQGDAVKAVANAVRRARTGLTSGKKPIGTFLFLGPTGVGKTETAKTVAQLYFGSDSAMIRLDMSEYQGAGAVAELLGQPGDAGHLADAVRDRPHSLVLLDEIEKAAPDVRNLFLQILDEGRATDGRGQLVDFTQTIIIATSNAGAEFIRESIQNNVDANQLKTQLLQQLQTNGVFTPEWLNRFDTIVVFKPLTRDDVKEIASRMLRELGQSLASHNIELTVAPDALDKLVDLGYDPEYGARPMDRAIHDYVEDAIAKQLLENDAHGRKQVTLTAASIAS